MRTNMSKIRTIKIKITISKKTPKRISYYKKSYLCLL